MKRLGLWSIAWEYKLADCWVGVFWDLRRCGHTVTLDTGQVVVPKEWHIWICFVPCLPLHVVIPSEAKEVIS